MSRATKPSNRAAATPPRGSLYVVVDATVDSTLGDVCFQTDADGFILQVRGGLAENQHPRFHADREAAEADANARIVAAQARAAITSAVPEDLRGAVCLQIRALDGTILLDVEIGGAR